MPKQEDTPTTFVSVNATEHGPDKELATSVIAGDKGDDTHTHVVISAEDGKELYNNTERPNH